MRSFAWKKTRVSPAVSSERFSATETGSASMQSSAPSPFVTETRSTPGPIETAPARTPAAWNRPRTASEPAPSISSVAPSGASMPE